MDPKELESLIPFSELQFYNNLDLELLNKIRFFITISQGKVNYESIYFDLEKKVFYNDDTKEIYEIKKDANNNQYEIIKSHNHKPITRVRKPDNSPPYMNNAAFTKVGFLIINILTFSILTTMIILLNK